MSRFVYVYEYVYELKYFTVDQSHFNLTKIVKTMDFIIEEEEYSLNQLINKCRFCFRTLIEREQKINVINKLTEKKFYEVTKIKVRNLLFILLLKRLKQYL